MGGLKNRFNRELLQSVFAFHTTCSVCGQNGADAHHHILSGSSERFIPGKHNSSLLNACPIHNHGCHLYNPALHKPEEERRLLKKTLEILVLNGYEFKEIDLDFFGHYGHLYKPKTRS